MSQGVGKIFIERKKKRKERKRVMKTKQLIKYDFPAGIIDVWEEAGIEKLLPIQSMAIRNYDLFGPKNLVVSAPTSSGKTFVGEMAAVKNAADKKKAFYLVPLKALAEEKYRDFGRKYNRFGYKTVISTRDHRGYDYDIDSGNFSIAIVVYEKFQQMITRNPGLLNSIGLIVVDELQMLSDETRGPNLEVLMTKLRMLQNGFKILGLSAVLKNCEVIPQWLNADFLEFYQRPVELRRGVIYKGMYEYETFNTCESGTEKMHDIPQGNELDIMKANVLHLAKRREQCLVFVKDKSSTRSVAAAFALQAVLPPAQKAIRELMHIEDTSSNRLLLKCLKHGIAFHNADMNLEERETIERHFRAGNIGVLCSTTTLAMGVNLPVRNVFIEPKKWQTNSINGRPVPVPIDKSDFENMAGRAGRLSHEKEFGRAFLIAANEADSHSYKHMYIEGEIDGFKTHLLKDDLATIILNLVSSDICRDADAVRDFITNTLSWSIGDRNWRFPDDKLDERIAVEIRKCLKYGLLEQTPKGLTASKSGRVCANKGISVDSAITIVSWFDAVNGRNVDNIEILYIAARTEDAGDYYMNMSTQEYHHAGYHLMLDKLLDRHARELFSRELYEPIHRDYPDVKAMKVALVMNEWINETPTVEIESRYNVSSGAIQRVSGGMSWIVDAIAGMAFVMDMGEILAAQLEQVSTRLLNGVGPEGIWLAGLNVKGLTRAIISKLEEAHIIGGDAFSDMPHEELEKLIPGWLIKRIRQRVKEREVSGTLQGDFVEAGLTGAAISRASGSINPQGACIGRAGGKIGSKSNDRFDSGTLSSMLQPPPADSPVIKVESIRDIPGIVKRISKTDTTVLITGETGVGKEFLARQIFTQSGHSTVFKAYNCSGKNELIESELFGYKKGAFTGADRDTVGLIEKAKGGTLFLDEIGEMPMNAQAKLLRFLQNKSIRPVGSDAEIQIDVRIIAATNEDLREAIQNGRFREDLFHRLNVFPLHILPLRDRKSEIPVLGNMFLKKELGENFRNKKRIPVKVYEQLKEYDWPGNVRELKNAIKRAIALSKGRDLCYADIVG